MTGKCCLVLDTIPYRGGSKIATEKALRLWLAQGQQVAVLGHDPHSWRLPGVRFCRLYEPAWLIRREQGVAYFLRHGLIAIQLLLWALCLRADVLLGASGPGNDLALYGVKGVLRLPLLQWVHGPVARSRTLGRVLARADRLFYLSSSRDSLLAALQAALPPARAEAILQGEHWQPIENGLARDEWPTPSRPGQQPQLFWAASLLKWKGLDTLVAALRSMPQPLESHICYLRPTATGLGVSDPCPQLPASHWYEAPGSLDAVRARCNIFVSTSRHEPFGLSILEAMAAGHAVVIPADGAYWSRILVSEESCLTYQPNDSEDLARQLTRLKQDPALRDRLGEAARQLAQRYHAEQVYAPVVTALLGLAGISQAELLARNS